MNPHPHHRKTCPMCREQFFSTRADAITCSVRCRVDKFRHPERARRDRPAQPPTTHQPEQPADPEREKFWTHVDRVLGRNRTLKI